MNRFRPLLSFRHALFCYSSFALSACAGGADASTTAQHVDGATFVVNNAVISVGSAIYGISRDEAGAAQRIVVYLSSETDLCDRVSAAANDFYNPAWEGLVANPKSNETIVVGNFALTSGAQQDSIYTLAYPASLLNGPSLPPSGAYFHSTNSFNVIGHHVQHDRWDYGEVNDDGSVQVWYTSDSNQVYYPYSEGNATGQLIAATAQMQPANTFYLTGAVDLRNSPTAQDQNLEINFAAKGKSAHNTGAVSGSVTLTSCPWLDHALGSPH